MKKIALLLAFLSFAACSDDDDKLDPCTTNVVPALEILVTNQQNVPITSGITVTATDGEFIEVLQLVPVTKTYSGVFERAGTYVITVTGDGYEPYASDPVTVSEDRCHVITQERTVKLGTL